MTIREVGKAGDGNPEGYTTISVSYDEKGIPVTTVSVTDANGNVLGSTSVSEHNTWDVVNEDGNDIYINKVIELKIKIVEDGEEDIFHIIRDTM